MTINKMSSNKGVLFAIMTAVSLLASCISKTQELHLIQSKENVYSETDPRWQLVWHDEFVGDELSNTDWNVEINCDGGGNNEQQCYTDSRANVYVKDGLLTLVALLAPEGSTKPFTSARINTKNHVDFKYGRFEIRAKLPRGQGAWPAIWMLPTQQVYGGWPKSGEIDIMEAVNLGVIDNQGNEVRAIHGTLHYGLNWPKNLYSGKAYRLENGANPADGFHVYALEWEQDEIRWYVDNTLFATQRASRIEKNNETGTFQLSHKGWFSTDTTNEFLDSRTLWGSAPFDQAFHFVLNFAVGGNWPENTGIRGVDKSVFNAKNTMQIDYIRAYQCSIDRHTGRGCATIPVNYESTLVAGHAPTP
ncbi:Beta-glucanase precursor [Pseudoalteromonas luteoviolacea B = ATCC 29581]|nr:Beta-glucanase precursor [Pseudoalteromonas luteoviolacea B = ATCC 29581]